MNRHYRDHEDYQYSVKMPQIIQDFYFVENYALIEIEGFDQLIPMPFYKKELVESANIDFWNLPLEKYAEGFLDGYYSQLIPEFGSPDSKKEKVFQEVRLGPKPFYPSRHYDEAENKYSEAFIQAETIYKNGYFEGRRYKAWEIIFVSPNEFIQFFEQARHEATLKMVERKYKDIANQLFFPKVEHTFQTQINFGYIDIKNNESPIKGNSFYKGFIEWMTKKYSDLHPDIFNRVKDYCQGKIEMTEHENQENEFDIIKGLQKTQNNISFYSDIAHNLYVGKTNIGATKLNDIQYIEEMHKKSEFQGILYYQNLIPALIPHWGKDVRNDYFKRLVKYCNQKINEYPNPLSLYQDEIDASTNPSQIEEEILQSETSKLILEYFNLIDKNKEWKYAFKNEKDRNVFTKLLTTYFEDLKYELPAQKIILQKGSKSRFAKTLKDIYFDLMEIRKLKTDVDFYDIIRVLNHFEKETDIEIYNAMKR